LWRLPATSGFSPTFVIEQLADQFSVKVRISSQIFVTLVTFKIVVGLLFISMPFKEYLV
jgi:hypothetical protein